MKMGVSFLLTAFLTLPIAASAQLATNNSQAVAVAAGINGSTDLIGLIGRVIYIVLGFLGVVFLCLMLYAGFLYMTAQGDPKKVEAAKTTIRNAIIGMVLIASSFAIVTFVLNALNGAASGNLGGVNQVPVYNALTSSSGGACLGQGIVESNFPARDANSIPRNTPIMITFKQPIDPKSFIAGWTGVGDTTHTGLNSAVVQIFRTADGIAQALPSEKARVGFTADFKTFVIRPVDYLGSPTASVGYTVVMKPGTSGVLKKDGTPAFSGVCATGYSWQFETSTVIDLTPPHVVATTPSSLNGGGGSYARNIVIQIIFSKAMDPTTVTGSSLQDLLVSSKNASGNYIPVAGDFSISNQYQTVEFVPSLSCGQNSCGRTIYCLPGPVASASNEPIAVTAKAATVDKNNPPQAQLTSGGSGLYDGIVDVNGNSLDGNDNGRADKTAPSDTIDDYNWSFGTTNEVRLQPPQILSTVPGPVPNRNSNVKLDQPVIANFDSILQSSTVNSDTVTLEARGPSENAAPGTFWWTTGLQLQDSTGAAIPPSKLDAMESALVISHRVYLPSGTIDTSNNYYNPHITSGVQDDYQNCFNPAGKCGTGSGGNCCNDKPQDNSSDKKCNFTYPSGWPGPTPKP